MDEHPNATRLREIADGMAAGDIHAGLDAASDDIEWHEIGGDEPIVGKQALMRRFEESFGGAEIKVETHDVVANDEHAIQLANVTASRNGRTLQYRTAEIFHMRDGKITARWSFSDDTARIVEFFS